MCRGASSSKLLRWQLTTTTLSPIYSDTTQLNQLDCQVANDAPWAVLNVVDHTVGHDVRRKHYFSVFRFFSLAIIMDNFPWSDELEEKFIDLWHKNERMYDVSPNRSSSVVGPIYSDTTQLSWTFSWVELCRYEWGFTLTTSAVVCKATYVCIRVVSVASLQ